MVKDGDTSTLVKSTTVLLESFGCSEFEEKKKHDAQNIKKNTINTIRLNTEYNFYFLFNIKCNR